MDCANQPMDDLDTMEIVQQRIFAILMSHAGPMEMSPLNLEYKQKHGSLIDYKALGFTKLSSFMESIPEIVCKKAGSTSQLSLKPSSATVAKPVTASSSLSSSSSTSAAASNVDPSAEILAAYLSCFPVRMTLWNGMHACVVDSYRGIQASAGYLAACSAVGVKCEAGSQIESISYIAVSVGAEIIFVFDALAILKEHAMKNLYIQFFKNMLENPKILKIFHDSRNDGEMLQRAFGIKELVNVHDTQVSLAILDSISIDLQNRHQPPIKVSYGDAVKRFSLGSVVEVPEKDNWANTRPLQPSLQYAAFSVMHNVALKNRILLETHQSFDRISRALSESYCHRWNSCDEVSMSEKTKVSVPINRKLELTFDETQDWKVQYREISDELDDVESKASSSSSPAASSIHEIADNQQQQQDDPDLVCLLDSGRFPEELKSEIMKVAREKYEKEKVAVTEIVIDIATPVCLRFEDKSFVDLTMRNDDAAEFQQLVSTIKGDNDFNSDNRLCFPGALHRISAARWIDDSVNRLTCRVGRHMSGSAALIRDILSELKRRYPVDTEEADHDAVATHSLLLLGVPGSGKTTLLRDVARIMADEFKLNVVVVDTSNEIAGNDPKQHDCIGRARRIAVAKRELQHEVMLEAVKNHTPDVIIIDEIGTEKEAKAAKTIAERGVVLVATAHGQRLQNLLKNPDLKSLVGSVQPVTLGDAAAARNKSANGEAAGNQRMKKTVLERAGAPVFSHLIELQSYNKFRVHTNVGLSVDRMLEQQHPPTQLRWMDPSTGRMFIKFETDAQSKTFFMEALRKNGGGWLDELVRLTANAQ